MNASLAKRSPAVYGPPGHDVEMTNYTPNPCKCESPISSAQCAIVRNTSTLAPRATSCPAGTVHPRPKTRPSRNATCTPIVHPLYRGDSAKCLRQEKCSLTLDANARHLWRIKTDAFAHFLRKRFSDVQAGGAQAPILVSATHNDQEKFAFFPPNPPSYDENFKNRTLAFIPKDGSASLSSMSHNPAARIPYLLYRAPSPQGYEDARSLTPSSDV